ncbi:MULTISPECIES: hypothetical protein [unclassified Vibrio]|uniref:Uncharacterized protein n=1 Tax=Vibrio sp. HB236076 TaxID=3232307 RepID=A0AB39HJY6_9VIBR|nr:hypothetical protein [Vibrio sp. HB161653]MDP5252836.1 hypothetical protein [Vibrio sp. HB161653]
MELTTFTSIWGAIIGALTGSVGAALLGAAIGAGLSALFIVMHETNRERKNRALDLIQEYTSPDYIQLRNEAGQALRKALEEQETPSWDNLYHNLSKEEWQKISKIEHFYKKLNFMVEIGEVDGKYIGKYFEKEFWHWQNSYFSKINIASKKKEMSFSALGFISKL